MTKTDYNFLFLGGRNNRGGDQLREENDKHYINSQHSNNWFGFTALPAGVRTGDGSFFGIGRYSFWLCSLDTDLNFNKSFELEGKSFYLSITSGYKVNSNRGFSIRCLKD